MTDSKPRKTLTLTKKRTPDVPGRATGRPGSRSNHAESERGPNEPRKRSGARARQVAQQQLQRAEPVVPGVAAPKEGMPARKATRASAPGNRPHPEKRQSRDTRDTRNTRDTRDTRDRGDASRSRDDHRGPRIQRLPRTRTASSRRSEVFQVFAPCPKGLEDALHAELHALGYEALRKGRAGCHFQSDWSGILRANLYSRLATRVLVQVAHAPVQTEDDILGLARETEWERWFGPEQTLRVDTSAVRSPMQSLQYCNLRAKDGICDRLREIEGARPDIDTVRPDAKVHLFLDEHSATLYLDTTGESLFKRGWRLDKGEAPLRENLAAGLIALAGWDPSAPLMDPFCGSGTILIEAAWIALGVPPGIWRPFGFERLREHDARHWRDIKDDARSRIATQLDAPLIGHDIDPRVIAAAQANQERARLSPDTIHFSVADARHVKPPTPPGWIVSNPPYGERMQGEEDFWPAWAENLKRNYAGWSVSVINSDLELPSQMRLKPKRRYPVFNGALDCRLFTFEMVEKEYRR